MNTTSEPTTLDSVVNLMKRRGFVFPTADIYGGANGLYDLGPLGTLLNDNIKNAWKRRFIQMRDDMLPLDAAILTPAAVLKASGHVDSFTDPLIECGNCHIRLRADHFLEEDSQEVFTIRWRDLAMLHRKIGEKRAEEEARAAATAFYGESGIGLSRGLGESGSEKLPCPNCGEHRFGEPRLFNMMFKTTLGAVDGEGATAYLRPETAQGIFTNFKNVLQTYPRKLPFGIGQVGKSFRNEITTGNSLFRVRELEQMEIEYFVKPGEDEAAFEMWLEACETFLHEEMGINPEKLRRYEHAKEKLSHYSKRTIDFEYAFPFGWGELWGLANRTNYDVTQHQEASGRDLTYFDEETREKFIPYVIEPALGVGRMFLTVLIDSYKEYPQGRDGNGTELETVLHLPKKIAPIRVAVLPLMKKDGMGEKAREIRTMLAADFSTAYEESGAIGRRYRRQDEIGTPFCVTVDYQTLEDGTVTLRDRDTMEQKRLLIADLPAALA
jgi:glycyl-tRNA synthetase